MIHTSTFKGGAGDSIKYSISDITRMVNDLNYAAQKGDTKITIVNAGIMNAGKSSVFNAVLGKEDYFKVNDIITTKKNSEFRFKGNIYLVDTPGLAADNSDTKEAYEAYAKASVIVFVHSMSTGELHADELEAINDIKKCFPNPQMFLDRFILVGVMKSMPDRKSLFNKEVAKIREDMRVHCGINDFEIIFVGTTFYWKGVKYQADDLIDFSGVEKLKKLILSRVEKVTASSRLLAEQRLKKEKNILLTDLEKHKKVVMDRIYFKRSKYTALLDNFRRSASGIIRYLKSISQECK